MDEDKDNKLAGIEKTLGIDQDQPLKSEKDILASLRSLSEMDGAKASTLAGEQIKQEQIASRMRENLERNSEAPVFEPKAVSPPPAPVRPVAKATPPPKPQKPAIAARVQTEPEAPKQAEGWSLGNWMREKFQGPIAKTVAFAAIALAGVGISMKGNEQTEGPDNGKAVAAHVDQTNSIPATTVASATVKSEAKAPTTKAPSLSELAAKGLGKDLNTALKSAEAKQVRTQFKTKAADSRSGNPYGMPGQDMGPSLLTQGGTFAADGTAIRGTVRTWDSKPQEAQVPASQRVRDTPSF